jgi:hypothetical protein
VAPAAVVAVALAGVQGAMAVWGPQGLGWFAETGPVETVHAGLWLACVAAALVALAMHGRARDRINAVWLLMLSSLAAARERPRPRTTRWV